jgi:DNA-binding winged helix-turn-helix (wHTH) protein
MRLRFLDCEVDLETRELTRAGQPVRLHPKAFSLLEALMRERPRVVGKTELDETLWPEGHAARGSLGRLVSELREALGDAARHPSCIRTVHAVGYAFCAEVETVAVTATTQQPQIESFFMVWGSQPLAILQGEQVLGRGLDCDVRIDASGVSRHHARVSVNGGTAAISDLQSKNGTYVNRRRIDAPTPIRDGDEITLGTAVMIVRFPEEDDGPEETVAVR